MFWGFFKKNRTETKKIQELEQTIHELKTEIDNLKKDVDRKENRAEKVTEITNEQVAEKTNEQVVPKKEKTLSSSDIKILSCKEDFYCGIKAMRYELNRFVNRHNIIETIRLFGQENTKMRECHVSTFSDSDSCMDCAFQNIDDLEQLKDFPSPYMTFYIDFSDRVSDDYLYSMKCGSNSDMVYIYVDPKKRSQN